MPLWLRQQQQPPLSAADLFPCPPPPLSLTPSLHMPKCVDGFVIRAGNSIAHGGLRGRHVAGAKLKTTESEEEKT